MRPHPRRPAGGGALVPDPLSIADAEGHQEGCQKRARQGALLTTPSDIEKTVHLSSTCGHTQGDARTNEHAIDGLRVESPPPLKDLSASDFASRFGPNQPRNARNRAYLGETGPIDPKRHACSTYWRQRHLFGRTAFVARVAQL